MVAGSRPDNINDFLFLILSPALGLGVDSASNRNEYQKQKKMFLGSRARPAPKADKLTTICELIVQTMWDLRRLITLYASMACYRDSFMAILHIRNEGNFSVFWNSSIFMLPQS
jgi:hypothetical protein